MLIIGSGTCIKDGADRETVRDFSDFYPELRDRMRAKGRVLFVAGDIHRNKFNDHGGFYGAISSGIGRRGNKTKQPLDNYGILEYGAQRVDIRLIGRRPSDNIHKRIRVSDWSLI